MRHVPDEELHPYLDQALSRSQCVEIETHLAQCGHCRDRRDTIAALRDRTTALLGQLTPRNLIIPPPFEALAERLSRRPVTPLWQIRLRRAGLWAAGVMAAVGTGWAGRSILDPHRDRPLAVENELTPLGSTVKLGSSAAPITAPPASAPAADAAPATPLPLPEATPRFSTARSQGFRLANASNRTTIIPAPMLQLASALTPMPEASRDVAPSARLEGSAPFGPLWQQVQWEDALEKAGSGLPYIEGMLVIGVLLRPGEGGERPTSLVAQQDPSGELVLSIEGPLAQVMEILKSQAAPEIHASEWTRTPPDYVPAPGGGTRRINRVLTVTGRLSADSLNALARLATIR
jgi:hypothetical protein